MKKLIVMRGISGSGKSWYATNTGFKVVSADHFFMEDGVYRFDCTKLDQAHQKCMRDFLTAVQAGENIVVDNTNINLEDISPYVAVGAAMGYDVEIVQINVDVNLAASRNVHNVPPEKVNAMNFNLNRIRLPKRWKVTHIEAGVPS